MRLKFIIIFITLLLSSNLFLFKNGLWLYQDQSFWPKNTLEAFSLINSEFHDFTNIKYYLGVDQGILTFNNVLIYSFFYVVIRFFGSTNSQIFVSVFSYILA